MTQNLFTLTLWRDDMGQFTQPGCRNVPPMSPSSQVVHKMTLVSGSVLHRRRVWSYRGLNVIQTYNSHDVRNKTHNGFTWEVEWSFGQYSMPYRSREQAKRAIDHHLNAAALKQATGQT